MKFFKFANINVPIPSVNRPFRRQTSSKWINWGDDNLFAQELIDYSVKSVTHARMLRVMQEAVAGDGLDTDLSDIGIDHEFLDAIAADVALFDGFCFAVVYRRDMSGIANCYHVPFADVRRDRDGDGYWVSENWQLNQAHHMKEWRTASPEENPTQLVYSYIPSAVDRYYPTPRYVSALNYIALEDQLSKYHLSSVVNAAVPSTVFTMIGDPTEEEKEEFHRQFAKQFQGAENAGRFMTLWQSPEADAQVQVQQLEPSISDDGLEHYVEHAKEKILAAHGATSQVLAAVQRQGALGGDGNEIKQAWQLFNRQVASTHHRKVEEAISAVAGQKVKIKPHIPLSDEDGDGDEVTFYHNKDEEEEQS